MSDVRYQVPGVPPGPAAGLTAFTPAFVRHAASSAQSYKYGVFGGPAEPHAVTAQRDTQISPDLGDLATTGGARSSDAPDVWWTDDYNLSNYARGHLGGVAERPGGFDNTAIRLYDPVRAGPTTVLPVPAEDWRGMYQRNSNRDIRQAVLQRAKSLPWFPRVLKLKEGTWNG